MQLIFICIDHSASRFGKVLRRRRAQFAAAKQMPVYSEVFGIRLSFVDLVHEHNESVRRAVCRSAQASVLVLNFVPSIKRLFYLNAFLFLLPLSLCN